MVAENESVCIKLFGASGQVLEVVKRDCGKRYAMKVMHTRRRVILELSRYLITRLS